MEIDARAKAEKAKLQAALDRANGERTRLVYELTNMKRQMDQARTAVPSEDLIRSKSGNEAAA